MTVQFFPRVGIKPSKCIQFLPGHFIKLFPTNLRGQKFESLRHQYQPNSLAATQAIHLVKLFYNDTLDFCVLTYFTS
jgi:hypothetical protein